MSALGFIGAELKCNHHVRFTPNSGHSATVVLDNNGA
jgi:hypothetical protein